MSDSKDKKFGKVKFFTETKGYGFIVPDDGGKDLFFHVKNVYNGKTHPLKEEDHVSFVITQGRRGTEAGDVRLVA